MPAPEPAFWLLTGDTPAGPFPLAISHEKLAAKEITWETRACPVGAANWLPLRPAPGVGPTDLVAQPIAPGPTADGPLPIARLLAEVPQPAARERRPWNPVAIAWLGLLFTAVWAGMMAALNNRRLGRPRPTWLGPAIGIGCTALDLVADAAWDVPIWLHAAGYLLTLATL